MYENYGNYILFFLVSSFIFTFVGLLIRMYTGRDWYTIVARIITVVVMFGLMIFTAKNDTIEQTIGNVMFLINFVLFILIPLIIGEIISSKIYKMI